MRRATTQAGAAAAPPQFSSDGTWFWDGRGWRSAITSDGRWRWDGRGWKAWSAGSPRSHRGPTLSVPLLLGIAALDLIGLFAPVTFFMSVAAAVVVLALDGRGLVTLNGSIKWRRLTFGQKVILGVAEVLLFRVLLLVYVAQRLYFAMRESFRSRPAHDYYQTNVAQKAEMEIDHFVPAPSPPDADELQRRLTALISETRKELPRELIDKVVAVADAILDVLPAYRVEGLEPHDQFIVERMVDDYLPAAVRSYLNLPAAYRSVPLPEAGGKTASRLLSDQLDLLLARMRQVVDASYKKDLQALLVHGRFLDSKFGRSSLTIS
jgi:hypothetical protein